MVKTLTALINDTLKMPGENIKDLAAGMRQLTPQDKLDLAARFVAEGYATQVTGKDVNGQEIVLASQNGELHAAATKIAIKAAA